LTDLSKEVNHIKVWLVVSLSRYGNICKVLTSLRLAYFRVSHSDESERPFSTGAWIWKVGSDKKKHQISNPKPQILKEKIVHVSIRILEIVFWNLIKSGGWDSCKHQITIDK